MIEVVFEDDYCLAINKPNNMLVHHAHHSRNVIDETSLVQFLQNEFNNKYYPIHRLDRKTSGIVLFAKQTVFVAKFQELFTSNLIQKTYLSLVRGYAPDLKIIDSPVKGRDANVYKTAETSLETLAKITLPIAVKPYDTSRYSLVKLTPKTGRLHQLRIHMNKISHPIIGDPKYGDKNHNLMFESHFKWDKLFLHAHSLSFTHPFTDKELNITANFPSFWKEMFDKFNFKY